MNEPYISELNKELDRYMMIIISLEKKAQNLTMISGTLITILVGSVLTRIIDYPFILTSAIITISLLLGVIIITRIAVRVHDQPIPLVISNFILRFVIPNDAYHIHEKSLDQILVNTKTTSNMSNKEKKEYKIKLEKKEIKLQRLLVKQYLCSLSSVKNNGQRITKYIKFSEFLFLLAILSGISSTIIFFILNFLA